MVALALVLSLAFGAGDQYLGSLTGSGHAWAAGSTGDQPPLPRRGSSSVPRRRDARVAARALLGPRVTYAALLGYGLMTISPVEHAHLTVATVRAFLISERAVFVGGLVTGPLFGWFGQQWRTRRAIAGALGYRQRRALRLEPLARSAAVRPIDDRNVWLAEVAAGLALAAALLGSRFVRTAQD